MTSTLNAPPDTKPTVDELQRICPMPCAASSTCPTYGGEFCPDNQALIDACTKC